MRDYYCPDMENCQGRRKGACVKCPMLRTRVSKPEATAQDRENQYNVENTQSILPEASRNHYMNRFMKGQ